MTFFSRLRSSRSIYAGLKFADRRHQQLKNVTDFEKIQSNKSIGSVFSIAAFSACSLAFFVQNNVSMCDDGTSVRVGGKGSADYVIKGYRKDLPVKFVEELKAICQENLSLDHEEREFHGKPQNSFHRAVNVPDVVVYPRSEMEISEILKCCNKYKIPIVPYGGATSLEGHTLSPNGGVCIDMSLMKKVKSLHLKDMDVVVEPGIGWMELNDYLQPYETPVQGIEALRKSWVNQWLDICFSDYHSK